MTRVIVAFATAVIFASVVPAHAEDSWDFTHFDRKSTRAALAYKLNPDNLHCFLDATKRVTANRE